MAMQFSTYPFSQPPQSSCQDCNRRRSFQFQSQSFDCTALIILPQKGQELGLWDLQLQKCRTRCGRGCSPPCRIADRPVHDTGTDPVTSTKRGSKEEIHDSRQRPDWRARGRWRAWPTAPAGRCPTTRLASWHDTPAPAAPAGRPRSRLASGLAPIPVHMKF